MDRDEYEEMLRTLARIAGHQDLINEDLRASIMELREFNRQQTDINERQVKINQDVSTTLARVEALLRRIMRTEDNGRDA